jgi:hypothetical protein
MRPSAEGLLSENNYSYAGSSNNDGNYHSEANFPHNLPTLTSWSFRSGIAMRCDVVVPGLPINVLALHTSIHSLTRCDFMPPARHNNFTTSTQQDTQCIAYRGS